MNATANPSDLNESIVMNKNPESGIVLSDISDGDEFFKGLVQRTHYYEQFEERRSRITYSVLQTELGAFS